MMGGEYGDSDGDKRTGGKEGGRERVWLQRSTFVQSWSTCLFHSEILTSLSFKKNKILSPGLENNHTLKCCSGNFPT